MRSVRRFLGAVMAVALVAGCSGADDGGAPADTDAPVTVTLAPVTVPGTITLEVLVTPRDSVDEEEFSGLVDLYARRLLAMAPIGTIEKRDAGIAIVFPAVDAAVATRLEAIARAKPFSVEVRPVLGRLAGVTASDYPEQVTPPDVVSSDAPAALRSLDGDVIYQLGPAAFGGSAVESASAEVNSSGDGWIVSLVLVDGAGGLDLWNELTALCYARDERCPDGGMAIVLDGLVLSAPEPQTAAFESRELWISGAFDEVGARMLARALSAAAVGSTPVFDVSVSRT